MPNNRIFYACQAVAIAKTGYNSGNEFKIMHGVQSVGLNTNFTLEQAFELGQVNLYSNEEDIADVEVTIEKLIDGYPLLYLQAVGTAGTTNVVDASNKRCDVYLALYEDSVADISGETPSSVVVCSGMYVSSVSYSYPVDGNATESLTLVGNDKFWNSQVSPIIANAITQYNGAGTEDDSFNGSDQPAATGLVRRSRVDIVNCLIPPEVCSQKHQGATNVGGQVIANSGIQSINISADFGRENQLELGRFGPYNKYATFPFEVTCEFEVNATSGDLVSVSGFGKNLTDRAILIKDLAGTVINLGNKNKLTGITYSGGDTGGGIATITYSYSTFNTLTVNGGGTSYWT
jgi:hypothetical protein